MILYSIRNWNSIYENNRSRTVTDLRWVPIPNHHDGEHYCRLMLRKDAAEIFSAWILILQVASRCHPRGTLMRSNGKPHDEDSLALKTRAPVSWFQKALPILAQMSWIEHVAFDCQEPVTQLTVDCHPPVEEGREGIEGKEVALRAPVTINLPKRKSPERIGYLIPTNLLTDEFKKNWDEWVQFRMKKKPCKDWNRMFKVQLEELSKWGEAGAIQALKTSIMNDWQGLFAPKNFSTSKPPKRDYGKNPTLELHERTQL